MSEPSRYLTQYGLMAEKHWREFRPKMVTELEGQGRLMEALWEAQETTSDEMEVLTRSLETEQELTPQQRLLDCSPRWLALTRSAASTRLC